MIGAFLNCWYFINSNTLYWVSAWQELCALFMLRVRLLGTNFQYSIEETRQKQPLLIGSKGYLSIGIKIFICAFFNKWARLPRNVFNDIRDLC